MVDQRREQHTEIELGGGAEAGRNPGCYSAHVLLDHRHCLGAVTRFTSPTQTDWVMRCTARKVLRVPEHEPVVLPPAKVPRAA
jgi:hypothetical protein